MRGFSNRFTIYLGFEGASLDGGQGFEGLADDDEYDLAFVEFGGRYHFRPAHRLMPYADVALAVLGLGYDSSGSSQRDDVTYGGAGISMGGGLLCFVSPRIALDAGMAFTPGALMERNAGSHAEDVDVKLTGARIHVGISVYPFR